MEHATEMPALNIPPERICVPAAESTKRWLSRHQRFAQKFHAEKLLVQAARLREFAELRTRGFLGRWKGEHPPPSALAARPSVDVPKQEDAPTGSSLHNRFIGHVWGWFSRKDSHEDEGEDSDGAFLPTVDSSQNVPK
jgi:hypothetical protein